MAALTDGRGRVETFSAPDGRLEAFEPQAAAWLAKAVGASPSAVFVTWEADPHPDHKAAARIAARQASVWGAALYAYPVWGLILADHEPAGPRAPGLALDVSAWLERKRAAIAAHRSQTGRLICDDPNGFRLRDEDLRRHLRPAEVFMELRSRS